MAFKPSDWEKKDDGGLPIIRIQNLNNEQTEYNYFSGKADPKVLINNGDLLFSWSGSRGTSFGPHIWKGQSAILNQHIFKIEYDESIVRDFFYQILKFAVKEVEENLHGGVGLVHITKGNFEKIQISLPPIEIQREIVAEIEKYQKIIDGAKQVVENWKPHIDIDPGWPMVKLGDVCDVRDGTHASPQYVTEGYPLITSKNLKNGFIDFSDVNFISRRDLDAINKRSKVDDGDILMPMVGTIGNPVIADISQEYGIKNVALIKFYINSRINNQFLKYILASVEMQSYFEQQSSGSTQKFIPLGFIRSLSVPLPPLETQHLIVAEIEAEKKAVDGCRELMALYEGKIKTVIERVWGKE